MKIAVTRLVLTPFVPFRRPARRTTIPYRPIRRGRSPVSFIHMSIYVDGGFIGETNIGFRSLKQITVRLIGEKTLEHSNRQGFDHP